MDEQYLVSGFFRAILHVEDHRDKMWAIPTEEAPRIIRNLLWALEGKWTRMPKVEGSCQPWGRNLVPTYDHRATAYADAVLVVKATAEAIHQVLDDLDMH